MKIVLAVMLLLLSGCSVNRSEESETRLKEEVETVLTASFDQPNYTKAYYTYYLPPDVGRYSGDALSNTFNYAGTDFIMNLNVDYVLYEDDTLLLAKDGAIFTDTGLYKDTEGNIHSYTILIHALTRGYVCYVHTDYTDYFAVCDYVSAMKLPLKMLRIARSVHIDEERIQNDFNLRLPITYQAHKIELFQNMAPVDGTLEELLIDAQELPEEAENTQ